RIGPPRAEHYIRCVLAPVGPLYAPPQRPIGAFLHPAALAPGHARAMLIIEGLIRRPPSATRSEKVHVNERGFANHGERLVVDGGEFPHPAQLPVATCS